MWVVFSLICLIFPLIPSAPNSPCPMPGPKMVSTRHLILGRHFIWLWRSHLMFLDWLQIWLVSQKVKISIVSLAQYKICMWFWPTLLQNPSCLQILPNGMHTTNLHQISASAWSMPLLVSVCHSTWMFPLSMCWDVDMFGKPWLISWHDDCFTTYVSELTGASFGRSPGIFWEE